MPPARTILFGFSQGTMMALHVGLRRKTALAGIVGFSGRLLEPETLAAELAARPPVLLIHGDQDPMVPFASLAEAAAALTAAGVATTTHVSRGVGHGIAPDGLGLALGFIRQRLGLARLTRPASQNGALRGPYLLPNRKRCLYLEACQTFRAIYSRDRGRRGPARPEGSRCCKAPICRASSGTPAACATTRRWC